jgi:hypothetical protein
LTLLGVQYRLTSHLHTRQGLLSKDVSLPNVHDSEHEPFMLPDVVEVGVEEVEIWLN